jgi:2-C-methyl-D-erythritol 4-phosphate cytidylyltransferase
MTQIAVVVLAAGTGTRFGHRTNKVWLLLGDRRIITHSLLNATKSFPGCRTVLVIDPVDEEMAREVLVNEIPDLKVEIVNGGRTRHDSELNALRHLAPDILSGKIDVILIHDGARPLASSQLFSEIAAAARVHGGALPTLDVDPLEIDIVTENRIVRVQTPQGFRAKEVLAAYTLAEKNGFIGTDTAACMEEYFPETQSLGVPGEPTNIKITFPQDLEIAERILSKSRD